MMALVAHELRVAMRQTAWPLALGMHLAAAVLFVAVWGASGGVPLWTASALSQLVAADRLFLAVLLTWLVTPLCSLGADTDLVGWSAVSGASVTRLLMSRAAAAVILGVTMIMSATPVAAMASQISGASASVLVAAVLEMLSFALLTIGLTAAASFASRNPLIAWIAAMVITGIAAFGVRLLTPGAFRIVACTILAGAGVSAAAATAAARWPVIVEQPIEETKP